MIDFFRRLFDGSGFVPRWYCGDWYSDGGFLGWLHIGSDVATWLAYTAIPFVLAYFLFQRRDVVFPRILWLFAAFIFACGMVHLLEAVLFWQPVYRLSGLVKFLTAVVSLTTVVALIRVAPDVVALPGLAAINEQLKREISERERAEERFRMVVEASPSAAVMVDAQGTIALVNTQAQELFGYEPGELIGQSIERLVPERSREHHPDFRRGFFAHPAARPMGAARELYGRRKDGSEFPVEIGLNPIETPEGLMVLSAILDVTERQRTEMALREVNRTLREKNREMEQFVYTVSHDLKSPLVTILGFVGVLNEDVADGRLDEVERSVERIERAARHMSDLIGDLLELSRIGRASHTLMEIDIGTVVRQVLDRVEEQVAAAGVQVELQEPLPRVMADRSRIAQVFENLLTNAIKYGSCGPSPSIQIGAETAAHEVRLFVRDNGPGIEPEYHEKIFGLFQRLDTRQEGTGVGLALVARVMDVHGGRVWVESAAGQGATFWLAFPKLDLGSCGR
jgi:two-component system, LuxR family, sensor kinase FixL